MPIFMVKPTIYKHRNMTSSWRHGE